MVTSNKAPEKKVVKMGDTNNGVVVPQRTLIGEVNEHITCPLCHGYYIDATTIVECLHSFCRSCIIKHLNVKSYCPVCEMMINSAKPNIKPDKALQDIVYKLVPGLFQKEMERRQHFYSSRPGPAASATPEQRGEDTERIIFSPEDVISFSLEYADITDSDSISSKSSDSNEPPSAPGTTRRYMQCPAVVNISHLKKFLCMKFDIDCTQFAIDILYKRVPLPDYYTLMDIAYIYNWKRNEPMRFFYQIIDYVAIRNRIFDINRKSSQFQENKSSSAAAEESNVNSPVPPVDQGSEASSGTDSPMPIECNMKQSADSKKPDKEDKSKEKSVSLDIDENTLQKTEDEVEKSQFLNSFELTPKSNSATKTSPLKPGVEPVATIESASKTLTSTPKSEVKVPADTLKRKYQIPPNTPELKKLKVELEKTKLTNYPVSTGSNTPSSSTTSSNLTKSKDSPLKPKGTETATATKTSPENTSSNINVPTPSLKPKEIKPQQVPPAAASTTHSADSSGIKRSVPHHVATSKRKPTDTPPAVQQQLQPAPQKTISPLKIQVPKLEIPKIPDVLKPPLKKIPDLKPSTPLSQHKTTPVNKVRMDLLANNSDPTIDRSKILSQVKTSLSSPNVTPSGDPLKSLFDSCKINIPSSLSITLTDQKLDPRNSGDTVATDQKKNVVNKNLASVSNSLTHKVPSPPVHNYIEILKLPESEMKKPNKPEIINDSKSNPQNKVDTPTALNKLASKSSEPSAKGPIPNLKPIADTKLAKQSAAYGGAITFQQTFEQQIQTLQGDKKSKGPKNKSQVPKLVPVPSAPKTFNAASKPGSTSNNPPLNESKNSTALDLSSPHSVPSPTGPPQNLEKAFETMQSIANLAKKQSMPQKGMSPSMTPSQSFCSMASRALATNSSNNTLRIPSTSIMNQIKLDKNPNVGQLNVARQESFKHTMKPNNPSPTTTPPTYQMTSHTSSNTAQPSPRQVRSPSSSPKLVIAEDKHLSNSPLELSAPVSIINQSNQITSTQLPSSKSELSTAVAGPSKPTMKSLKPMTPGSKLTANRQPITPTMKPMPSNLPAAEYLQPQFMHSALIRHQMEMTGLAWMKRQQYNFDILKSMSNMAHQSQNDYNKDKQ